MGKIFRVDILVKNISVCSTKEISEEETSLCTRTYLHVVISSLLQDVSSNSSDRSCIRHPPLNNSRGSGYTLGGRQSMLLK